MTGHGNLSLPVAPRGADAWAMIVAILGTTISPYLFFWQASEEVEEEKAEAAPAFADFSAVRALYWSAVLNGLLALARKIGR